MTLTPNTNVFQQTRNCIHCKEQGQLKLHSLGCFAAQYEDSNNVSEEPLASIFRVSMTTHSRRQQTTFSLQRELQTSHSIDLEYLLGKCYCTWVAKNQFHTFKRVPQFNS